MGSVTLMQKSVVSDVSSCADKTNHSEGTTHHFESLLNISGLCVRDVQRLARGVILWMHGGSIHVVVGGDFGRLEHFGLAAPRSPKELCRADRDTIQIP